MDVNVLIGRLVGAHLMAYAFDLQFRSIPVLAGLFEAEQVVLELFLAQLSKLDLVFDLLVHILRLGTRALIAGCSSSIIVELIHELAELGLV